MNTNLTGVWGLHEASEPIVQAALQQQQFRLNLAGHPEVPAAIAASSEYTPEGYWSKALSIGKNKDVVTIPVYGTMSRYYSYDNAFSNTFMIRMLDYIRQDENKKGVVLDFNTNGGTVDSTDEFAAAVAAFRQEKPIVASVKTAYSAGYWVASQTNEIQILPSPVAGVGSIGTIYFYVNQAKALEKAGLEVEIFRSTGSQDKARINSIEPLTEEARAEIQALIDECNKLFKGGVRAGRGAKIQSDDVFTGKAYGYRDGIKQGLADRTGSLQTAYDQVISLSKQYKNA